MNFWEKFNQNAWNFNKYGDFRRAKPDLFHLVFVDKFEVLPVVDGVYGEQRRVEWDRGGVPVGAERQMDIHEVEAESLLPG